MANEVEVRRGSELVPRPALPTLARMEREMDRLFNDFFGDGPRALWPRWWPGRAEGYASAPALDVYEENDDIIVKAELPGLTKDDIEVNVTDHQLTLKGEKKKKEEIKEDDYYRCERSFGSFSRVVDLPADIQTDKAKASFKDGLLEIRVPKTEEAKKKHIKVKVD
jgi:HSP20 family protein